MPSCSCTWTLRPLGARLGVWLWGHVVQLHNVASVMFEVMAVSVEMGGPQELQDEQESEFLAGKS